MKQVRNLLIVGIIITFAAYLGKLVVEGSIAEAIWWGIGPIFFAFFIYGMIKGMRNARNSRS